MYTFRPLDEDRVIADIPTTALELHHLRNTLVMALDYNPSSDEFVRAMEPSRTHLGAAFPEWIAALQKIKADGERSGHINFTFEDWISHWYVADFIDRRWTVAAIV